MNPNEVIERQCSKCKWWVAGFDSKNGVVKSNPWCSCPKMSDEVYHIPMPDCKEFKPLGRKEEKRCIPHNP